MNNTTQVNPPYLPEHRSPAPWHVGYIDQERGFGERTSGRMPTFPKDVVFNSKGGSVCSPHFDGDHPSRNYADAALIAAAPDLLAAAEQLAASAKIDICNNCDGEIINISPLLLAIAKAKGE